MAVYLVSYDLNEPDKNYQRLTDAIESYDKPCHILKSQWLICSDKSAKEIFNELVSFIDANDELFVCEINANRACRFKPETMKKLRQIGETMFASGLLGNLHQQ